MHRVTNLDTGEFFHVEDVQAYLEAGRLHTFANTSVAAAAASASS